MRKVLASDIDGTLAINGSISAKSIDNLKKFKDKGHVFLLCTGRDFENTKNLFEKYKLDFDGLVLCNGALILDKNLKEFKVKSIDKNTVKAIYEEISTNKEFFTFLVDGYKTYCTFSSKVFGDFDYDVFKITPEEIEEKYNSTKLISIFNIDMNCSKAETLKNYLNEKYGKYIVAYRNQFCVDVVPKGCSKSSGIASVLEEKSITDDNIHVIGDSWNDVTMFHNYKNSYTFNHCEDDLKKHATNLVDEFHHCVEILLK